MFHSYKLRLVGFESVNSLLFFLSFFVFFGLGMMTRAKEQKTGMYKLEKQCLLFKVLLEQIHLRYFISKYSQICIPALTS